MNERAAEDLTYGRVCDRGELEAFLSEMDREFPHPLSLRCDLGVFSEKLLDKGIVEGAWLGDGLVGVLAGYVNDPVGCEGYISVLVVRPEARGRRISSALLDAFLIAARDAGMRTVRVFTYKTNEAAFGLYTSHGFVSLGLNDDGDYELLKTLEK